MMKSTESNELDKFLFNQQEATRYLIRYGYDPLLINKEITHSYDQIAKSDPLFIWFSAAVLGSHQIGKTLAPRNNVILEHYQDTFDPAVIHHILNSPENIKALKKASTLLVQHEQQIAQPMYDEEYSGKKLRDVLNNTFYIEKLLANHLEIAGAKILDTYLPVPASDFSVIENRVAYFEQVFDEYFMET